MVLGPLTYFLEQQGTLSPMQAGFRPGRSTVDQTTFYILNTPLKFNPHPTFLGVTFDRTLSFKHHVLSLRKKFHSRFRAFRSIASASWGSSKESLCMYQRKPSFAPSLPMLPQAGFPSHLLPTSLLWRGCIDLCRSVQNPLAPFCCVLGKDTLRHFPLLGGLDKQF